MVLDKQYSCLLVGLSDVADADTHAEILTGGAYNDGLRVNSQLCVWDGATLSLENAKTWYWTSNTQVWSVAVGNVDGDSSIEIVTGGYHNDGSRSVAQLCVWNGATLALEDVKTWYWSGITVIYSVVIGNVDIDSNIEIVTGGTYYDGTRGVAQLCVWGP